MKDLQLNLSKWNDGTKSYYLEDYCISIKLSNSFSQIAAELSFELPCATFSSSLLAINVELGDKVTLAYKGTQIFSGKVIDKTLKGKAQTLSVTCYDYCWWVCKSNITKNFNNISVKDALVWIYERIGATHDIDYELGSNGRIMINSHLVKNKATSKVLYAIYSEVTKITGNYYYMHTQGDGATLTITEADKYYSSLTIQPPTSLNSADGNLIDYDVDESMQNMITRVDLYKTTGEEYDSSKNIELPQNDMKRYGVIVENVEVADDDTNGIKALAEGNKKLKEKGKPSEELTVTCFGDIWYKVAYGVLVKIPNTNYYDRFMYIISSEWTWSKQSMFDDKFRFISKLGLSPSKNKNLEDWTSIEEKQEDSNSTKSSDGSSDLVNRIIAELKSHLGLAYKWNGKSPADGGMDCSGYISYVYNQFSSELEIPTTDGKLYPPTQSMMHQGDDVTSSFPDNLRKCDIVFPHEGHVQAYIGNGKVIHSPQTGDVIKISDLNRDKIAKVIRVVPDSAWESESSNSNPNNGLASSNLVEFIKGFEEFNPNAYWDVDDYSIGYGTHRNTTPSAFPNGADSTCTEDQATQWVKDEANAKAKEIKNALSKDNVALQQNKFDCLVDIAYNNGTGDLIGGETWKSIINGEDKNTITGHLLNWNHADGKVSPGLTKRCVARVRMFFDGIYDSSH